MDPKLKPDNLLLLPRPKQIELLGAWVDAPEHEPVRVERRQTGAAGTAAQRYELSIRPETGIAVACESAAGERHARATLTQLRRQFGARLPALRITDEPTFATRGVMLDVSRNRVGTTEELLRIVDELAALKFNHLQLYTEHTFAYAGHEEAWAGASPITPDEVRLLDQRCTQRGIELVANQNCFGHLGAWLKLPKYAHLAETHGDWMFDVWPRNGPFSICPTDPASETFVDGLLDQLLPCFSSKLVNIGCDETFDVGWGRSKQAVAERGRAAVYLEFVAKISNMVTRRGGRPMFWADIALSHPESIGQIPKELIALAWGYEGPSVSDFDKWCKLLIGAERETWVCPGTSSWRCIFGRTTERRENINAAAGAGAAHGATGFLICDWGDTGHQQQWPIALHALAQGAQAAWDAAAPLPDPLAVSLHVHADESLALAGWLDELGDADLAVREVSLGLSRPGVSGRLRNQSAVFIDMHTKLGDALDVGAGLWEEAQARINQLAASIPAGLPPQTTDELRHTLNFAGFCAARAVERRRKGGLATGVRAELAARLRSIIANHRRLWLLRSRPGGLETSCAFLTKVLAELENA